MVLYGNVNDCINECLVTFFRANVERQLAVCTKYLAGLDSITHKKLLSDLKAIDKDSRDYVVVTDSGDEVEAMQKRSSSFHKVHIGLSSKAQAGGLA